MFSMPQAHNFAVKAYTGTSAYVLAQFDDREKAFEYRRMLIAAYAAMKTIVYRQIAVLQTS